MKLLPCKRCGRTPAFKPIDVCDEPTFYIYCKCGRATTSHIKDKCIEEWNKELGTTKQPTHAANVLAHKKGELAYAG